MAVVLPFRASKTPVACRVDVFSADIRRFHPDCTDRKSEPARRWLAERSHETYANQSVIAYAHDQPLGGATHQGGGRECEIQRESARERAR